MQKSNHDTTRSLNGVLDVMRGLNHRIGVLERAAPKKKPRKLVKRKRRT